MQLEHVEVRGRYALMIAALAIGCHAQAQTSAPAATVQNAEIARITFSPYSLHYSRNPEHRHVWLLGMEQESPDKSLRGAAFFSNSFGQESVYIFPWGGKYDHIFGLNGVYAKWTAGLLYGYKKPYENKVPLNHKGFSPGVIPSVGYQFNREWSSELLFLGTAGMMWSVSYRYQ
jgi:hypothetical protein